MSLSLVDTVYRIWRVQTAVENYPKRTQQIANT